MKIKKNSRTRFFRFIYLKLFRINDTPHKIAFGFGLGVFLGILPGTGPVASVVVAAILRANKAAALLGSLITNTWLSFALIPLSIKMGSVIMGCNYLDIQDKWRTFLNTFTWKNLPKLGAIEFLVPVVIGMAVIAFLCGLVSFTVILLVLSFKKTIHNKS